MSSAKIIHKHRYILNKLAKSNVKDRKKMLLNVPSQLFNVFRIICKLVSNGKVEIGKGKRHAQLAKTIGSSKLSGIKAISKQHGGAIASIIAGVLPFLLPLVSKLFK